MAGGAVTENHAARAFRPGRAASGRVFWRRPPRGPERAASARRVSSEDVALDPLAVSAVGQAVDAVGAKAPVAVPVPGSMPPTSTARA